MSRALSIVVALLVALSSTSEVVASKISASCPEEWCNAAESRDDSVIRAAIQNGQTDMCYCYCEPYPNGNKLLHVTACSEAVAFADLMISKPPNCYVDTWDSNGNTPLHDAAECCNTPMAYVFLSAGDDPLIANRADPESENWDGETPMCVAALQDDPDCAGIVNHLLEFGADICTKCPVKGVKGGKLPYDVAVNKIVKDIIEQNGGRTMEDGGICPDY